MVFDSILKRKYSIGLLIVAMVFWGCSQIGDIIVENTLTDECIDKASELILTDIWMVQMVDDWMVGSSSTWNDGSRIVPRGEILIFSKGDEKGRNVNYLYSDKPIPYYRGDVDEEGNILGHNSFEVFLILKETEKDNSIENFEVVDYEFVSCSWNQ